MKAEKQGHQLNTNESAFKDKLGVPGKEHQKNRLCSASE
jgi:hypothetical protein